jgi:hypothetical protein
MKEIKINSVKNIGNRIIMIYTLYETTQNEPFINDFGEEEITYNRELIENGKFITDRVPETEKEMIEYIKVLYDFEDWI